MQRHVIGMTPKKKGFDRGRSEPRSLQFQDIIDLEIRSN